MPHCAELDVPGEGWQGWRYSECGINSRARTDPISSHLLCIEAWLNWVHTIAGGKSMADLFFFSYARKLIEPYLIEPAG